MVDICRVDSYSMLMKNNIKGIILRLKDYVFQILAALLFSASLLFVYIQINQYLSLNSQKFRKEFLALNNYELISADTASLAVRLNLLSSVDYIKCIRGYYRNMPFYVSTMECDKELFTKEIIIQQTEMPDLKIFFTIGLSRQMSSVIILSIVFQALFFVIILSLGFYFLNAKEKYQKQFYERALKTAHDIRSPISALNVVAKSIESVVSQKQLKVLNSATERINAIADDLLVDFRSKGRNGNVVLNNILKDLINEKSEVMNSLEFSFSNSEDIIYPETVSKDILRITSNLINNAVEAGARRVDVSLVKREAKLVLTVRDNGSGIAPQNFGLLFSEGASFGKNNGNGIGLYQAKKIIESHKGSIDIASKQNEFTEVVIILPIG